MKNNFFLQVRNNLPMSSRLFWSILFIAMSLRIMWALLIPVVPVSDSAAYDVFALNLSNYSTYGWTPEQPNAYWPVGTSAIYAVLYKVFGHVYWPIVVLNILVGTGIVAIGMRVCRTYFGESAGTISGILLALWPSQVMFVTVLASELPFTLLTLAALDVWTLSSMRVIFRSVLIGILLAGASYIRPLALLLPFVYAASMAVQSKNVREHFTVAVISFAIMSTLIAPWSYRNYRLYDAFVPISTNGPVTLWMGNHPGTNGSYATIPKQVKALNDYERSKVLGKMAMDYIRKEPFKFIYRSAWKFLKLHAYETISVTWNVEGIKMRLGERAIIPLKALTQIYWVLVLLSALLGGYFLFLREKLVLWVFHPVIFSWAYYGGVYAVIVVQDRYHFSFIPFIATLASFALSEVIKNKAKLVRQDKR